MLGSFLSVLLLLISFGHWILNIGEEQHLKPCSAIKLSIFRFNKPTQLRNICLKSKSSIYISTLAKGIILLHGLHGLDFCGEELPCFLHNKNRHIQWDHTESVIERWECLLGLNISTSGHPAKIWSNLKSRKLNQLSKYVASWTSKIILKTSAIGISEPSHLSCHITRPLMPLKDL